MPLTWNVMNGLGRAHRCRHCWRSCRCRRRCNSTKMRLRLSRVGIIERSLIFISYLSWITRRNAKRQLKRTTTAKNSSHFFIQVFQEFLLPSNHFVTAYSFRRAAVEALVVTYRIVDQKVAGSWLHKELGFSRSRSHKKFLIRVATLLWN